MKKIFSKVEPTKLLHIIFEKQDILEGRQDIVDSNQFIQCSALNLPKDKTFKPHKHIWKKGSENVIAQESWVVVQGSVECTFYDLDNTILQKEILQSGDASFTLEGGHNYLILENNTLVYEYKTGPYQGQALDKEFL